MENEKKNVQAGLIDFAAFEANSDYFKPEAGVEYFVGFKSMAQGMAQVDEKVENGVVVKKSIPTLELVIDLLNNKRVELPYSVTSKRLALALKPYWENKGSEGSPLLFQRLFSLKRTGEGMQTKYLLAALGDKPKV